MTTNDMVVDVSLEWVLAAMSRSVRGTAVP